MQPYYCVLHVCTAVLLTYIRSVSEFGKFDGGVEGDEGQEHILPCTRFNEPGEKLTHILRPSIIMHRQDKFCFAKSNIESLWQAEYLCEMLA